MTKTKELVVDYTRKIRAAWIFSGDTGLSSLQNHSADVLLFNNVKNILCCCVLGQQVEGS